MKKAWDTMKPWSYNIIREHNGHQAQVWTTMKVKNGRRHAKQFIQNFSM